MPALAVIALVTLSSFAPAIRQVSFAFSQALSRLISQSLDGLNMLWLSYVLLPIAMAEIKVSLDCFSRRPVDLEGIASLCQIHSHASIGPGPVG
jgi:hypothetical protein